MASVSVSHMILFIASMVIAASVAGVFTTSVDRLSEAIDDQGLQISDNVRTDVEIISDNGTGACVYDCGGDGRLQLLLRNVGSRDIPAQPGQIDVLLDGRFVPASDMDVTLLGGATTWGPSEVVRLNVTRPGLASGDHRAKVIVTGDEEVFQFRNP
jgi:flagellar protein FlaG